MNNLWLEIRHSTFRLAAPLLLVIGLMFGIQSSYPDVSSWPNITQAFVVTAIFAAPFLAGFGAWEGLRRTRRNTLWAEATSSRTQVQVQGPHLFAAVIWVTAMSAFTLIGLTLRATVIGLYDSPQPASLLAPIASNLFSVTLGFVLGLIIQRWVAIIVAVAASIGLYTLDLMASGEAWIRALNPYHSFVPVAGAIPNDTTFTAQVAVTLAAAGLLCVVGMIALDGRVDAASVLTAVLSVALAIFGSGLAISQDGRTAVVAGPQDQDWTNIETSSGTTLRILAMYQPVTKDLDTEWSRVSDLFAKSDLAFTSLEQDLGVDYGEAPYPRPFRLDLNPLSDSIADASVEMMFYDITTCGTGIAEPSGDYGYQGDLIMRTWVEGGRDFGESVFGAGDLLPALQNLNALSKSQSADWIRDHTNNIRNCSWDRSDFP